MDCTVTITQTRRKPKNVLPQRRFDMISDSDDTQAQLRHSSAPSGSLYATIPAGRHLPHPWDCEIQFRNENKWILMASFPEKNRTFFNVYLAG
ncbi:uncharacterized protein ASPGLDRAFT_46358 [Aspergillus glaucus CBS 516.65]|uniref:Uncharacterized protein n=1 Tax=Aspergillus glaucus CBS 516.65 TaxID=1160497 RepID=A0A1L9VN95_ASPGL|nr:hypothetical protein ASPGLDRAFT_46358 [Aspergillus glaucus CBS 516.65]OJJ85350.1 hypothetical protein ASPGLDRAFT_46358 [Aspergillus glaucus CBS 516.65]